jgi:hypothetical protein
MVVYTVGAMSASDPPLSQQREQYRAAWSAVDKALAQELAAMSEDEGLKRALSLETLEGAPFESRSSSGLVEQQALFLRLVRR